MVAVSGQKMLLSATDEQAIYEQILSQLTNTLGPLFLMTTRFSAA
jgi:hypothetical protein